MSWTHTYTNTHVNEHSTADKQSGLKIGWYNKTDDIIQCSSGLADSPAAAAAIIISSTNAFAC